MFNMSLVGHHQPLEIHLQLNRNGTAVQTYLQDYTGCPQKIHFPTSALLTRTYPLLESAGPAWEGQPGAEADPKKGSTPTCRSSPTASKHSRQSKVWEQDPPAVPDTESNELNLKSIHGSGQERYQELAKIQGPFRSRAKTAVRLTSNRAL